MTRPHRTALAFLLAMLALTALALALVHAMGGLVLPISAAIFVVAWIFQFIGHAVEGKPPEFFHDWRFLLVGLRWWVAKVRGRA
jgi:uncharacterized membrane protein YGL010W